MIKAVGRNSRAAYHLVLHVRAIPLVFKVDGKHDGRATIMKDGCLPTKFQQKKRVKVQLMDRGMMDKRLLTLIKAYFVFFS